MIKKLTYIHISILILLLLPAFAFSAFLYKNYIIRHDKGWDILCDPYIVEKNDWVIKLFQRRGQIAEQDFPEFLNIFRRLNPHISDVNTVLPGQSILIPLKKIGADSLPGQSSGIVSIPFMTISKLPDIIQENSSEYKVQEGDCLSSIISRNYGAFGTNSYGQGVQLFKLINPKVVDENKIYPGQVIYVPNSDLQTKDWYTSIFDDQGKINTNFDIGKIGNEPDKAKILAPSIPTPEIDDPAKKSPLHQAASALNARLFSKGTYYFPKKGEKDLAIDMSQNPIMELEDGKRLLFCEKDNFSESDKDALSSYWKKFKIIPLSLQSNFEEFLDAIFKSDENFNSEKRLAFQDYDLSVEIVANWIISKKELNENSPPKTFNTCIFLAKKNNQTIPSAIKRYLSEFDINVKIISDINESLSTDPENKSIQQEISLSKTPLMYQNGLKLFVRDLSTALGYRFSENINISFPYAGMQIDAFSNLISSDEGKQILVDFGDFYGDAISAIQDTGLDIIQLTHKEDWPSVVKKILSALGVSCEEQFKFLAIEDLDECNIFFTLPGVIFQNQPGNRTLIVSSSLHHEIASFLNQSGNQTILVSKDISYQGAKMVAPDISTPAN